MVGFGKQIRRAKRDEWSAAYLDYDRLKVIIADAKRILLSDNVQPFDFVCVPLISIPAAYQNMSRSERLNWLKGLFLRELTREVEKISLFTLRQQGRLADEVGIIRFASTLLFQQFNSPLVGPAAIHNNRLYRHLAVGTEFLHLLRFICLNSIGVRKILKKYNKLFETKDEGHWYVIEENHLQPLSLSRSIIAIQNSLQLEFNQFYFDLHQSPNIDSRMAIQVIRLKNIIDCSHSIQRYTEITQQPFLNFLSQSSMIGTTVNFGGMDRASNEAMKWLIELEPESLLNTKEVELQEMGYRWPTPLSSGEEPARVAPQLKRQALSTIEEETNYDSFMSLKDIGGELEGKMYWGGVDRKSMTLNLLSKLLYTVNYYCIAPTANRYAINLGLDGAFGATLIGASSLSALFAAFIFSYWCTRSTFKSALLFSAACPVIGNLLYAVAISFKSMKVAVVGRFLVGFGSAEVVNRQLISSCVSFDNLTRASVLFVISDAAGMSLGPMLAAILDTFSGRDINVDLSLPFLPSGGLTFNYITSPGYVMSVLWFLELVALFVLFQEPARSNDEEDSGGIDSSNEESSNGNRAIENGDNTTQPRLKGYGSIVSQESSLAQSGRESILKLIFKNPGLPLTIMLFGYIELTCEVLISSCSSVVLRYFGWHGNRAGLLLACLGALVLPAHFVVEKASHYYSERRILFVSLELIHRPAFKHNSVPFCQFSLLFVCLCFFGIFNWKAVYYDIVGSFAVANIDMSNFTIFDTKIGEERIGDLLTNKNEFPYEFDAGPYIYISFMSAIFIGTIVMEGVDTSIMAKVTPAKLNSSFLNAGLLTTLVGTLGRVFADVIITSTALLDRHIFVDFVTVTFLPLMLMAFVGLIAVNALYVHLQS